MKLDSTTLHLLRWIAKIIRPSYRFDWSSFGWLRNDEFNRFLKSFSESDGFNSHRRWTLKQLLRLTSSVPGHTAECGVYYGAGSYLICQANASMQPLKIHHLFDSFEGLSAPSTAVDGGHWKTGDMKCSMESVQSRLIGYKTRFHKGWIPTTFHDVIDEMFSFVHIDVDLFQPTKDSVEFFYPRMSAGGIMLFDDYGFDTCPGATKAIDEFFSDKAEKPVSLSSGGAFIIKGVHVGG